VIAIDEINVGVARRSEEHGVAWGEAAIGVGARIDGSEVGFGFHDASGKHLRGWRVRAMGRTLRSRRGADEKLAEEFAGDQTRVA
jgi:hypothetical protein